MAKYPPSPPSLRWVFIGLRVFSTIVLAFALYAGFALVQDGDTLLAVRYLLGAGSFVAATWVSPYSVAFIVFLGLPILVLPVSTGSGVIFAAIFVIIFAWILWSRKRPIQLDPEAVKRAADDAVMPNAVRFVEEFRTLGWEQVGAVSLTLPRVEVISSLLLSPDNLRCAQVTDVVIAITSPFTGGRTLVTRNSGGTPMPPWCLANDHRGAKPVPLANAHDESLELLEANRMKPVPFDPNDVVDFFITEEKRHAEYLVDSKSSMQADLKGSGPLDASDVAAQRIREWKMAAGPTA